MVIGVFCFRNDLRLHDNPALQKAVEECDKLYLVYVFEDRVWKAVRPNRISKHRANFILESLSCLRENIRDCGGVLHLIQGNIEHAIPKFMGKVGAETCFISEENAWEEKWVENQLSQNSSLRLEYSRTLIHINDLPFNLTDLPDSFSKFRKLVENQWYVRPCIDKIERLQHSDFSDGLKELKDFDYGFEVPSTYYFLFRGGSKSAKNRLKEWIWDKHFISQYKETRNQLKGADFSSRFSPWLSNGCVSPREIYWEVKKYESMHGANESTYWLVFELLWRDYFHFFARIHGAKIFQKQGIHPQREYFPEPEDAESLFSAWKDGCTRNSFVNANMNELRQTGWMSNRGRQIVASYLINDMQLDWRRGAQWFEEQLIDYDVCSNYGNWLYLSGYGSDPRNKRYFNCEKQADMYDPKGDYTKDWA